MKLSFYNRHVYWTKKSRGFNDIYKEGWYNLATFGIKHAPMSRGMQLHYIPVTVFSWTDLVLDRISPRWECHDKSQETNWRHCVTGPVLSLFHERKGILKIDQSVKMPWHRLSMGVACSYSSGPDLLWWLVTNSITWSYLEAHQSSFVKLVTSASYNSFCSTHAASICTLLTFNLPPLLAAEDDGAFTEGAVAGAWGWETRVLAITAAFWEDCFTGASCDVNGFVSVWGITVCVAFWEADDCVAFWEVKSCVALCEDFVAFWEVEYCVVFWEVGCSVESWVLIPGFK